MAKREKTIKTDKGETYSERELAQQIRRKLRTKNHGDDSLYKRKPKHKTDYLEDLD
mgnify:FL=1